MDYVRDAKDLEFLKESTHYEFIRFGGKFYARASLKVHEDAKELPCYVCVRHRYGAVYVLCRYALAFTSDELRAGARMISSYGSAEDKMTFQFDVTDDEIRVEATACHPNLEEIESVVDELLETLKDWAPELLAGVDVAEACSKDESSSFEQFVFMIASESLMDDDLFSDPAPLPDSNGEGVLIPDEDDIPFL